MNDAPDRFLPYGRQAIDDADLAAVADVLRGDWLTGGPAVDAFEAGIAGAVGASHAVACANGTAALHLAAIGLELGPGTVAVVPSVTFVATANAARLAGAEIVFADVDPATGLMTPEDFAAALGRGGPAAKAVLPVHLNGQAPDIAAIAAMARSRGMAVIEDACHAIGGTYRAGDGSLQAVGSCADSDATIFSFHPVKTVTAGEGGAVACRDHQLARRLRLLRSHGITRTSCDFLLNDQAFDPSGQPNSWYYEMPEVGFNYRITDIQCALGLSQLRRLAWFVSRREALVARYDRALEHLGPMVRPLARTGNGRPSWHLYVVRIDFAAAGASRNAVMQGLREHGIGTQVHYLPVHRQPYYRDRYGELGLPGADAYYASCLSLPLFPAMDDADVDRVAGALATVLGRD